MHRLYSVLPGVLLSAICCTGIALGQATTGTSPSTTTPVRPTNPAAPTSTAPTNTQATSPQSNQLASSLQQRSSNTRLARVPQMFGDLLLPPDMGSFNFFESFAFGTIPLWAHGGGGPLKIGANNTVCPYDRFYYTFNHYANGGDSTVGQLFVTAGAVETQSHDFRIHTMGWEKTFLNNLGSVEIRLPVSERLDHISGVPFLDGAFNVPAIGNMSVITKLLLVNREKTAIAGGLGMEIPTGGDTSLRVADEQVILQNNAFYLSPFLAMLRTPTANFNYQVFSQLSVATNGNPLIYTVPRFGILESLGNLYPQATWQTGISSAYWLFRDRPERVVSGLAMISELHYTQSLMGNDAISGSAGGGSFSFDVSGDSSISLLNLTLGMHTVVGRSSAFRVGTAVPLSNDRGFDSEIVVQWNRFF